MQSLALLIEILPSPSLLRAPSAASLLGQSSRTMARSGLRMMPTFPSSPLRFRTAGFPQYGSKAGLSVSAFPLHSQVKPPPGIPWPCSGLHLTFASPVAAPVPSIKVEEAGSVWRRHESGTRRSTPGALATVRVILSRSIIA